MRMYRIVHSRYENDPFNPIGARINGGRWNSKGVDTIYLSRSEATCILEILVHVPTLAFENIYSLFSIDVPDNLIYDLDTSYLQQGWQNQRSFTQLIGDTFLKIEQPKFFALKIPSAVTPRDDNFIVNMNFHDAKRIFDNAIQHEFSIDNRIFD